MANVVEILVTAKNLTGPAMAGVNAEVNKAGGVMRGFHKATALAGVGLAAFGYESVKMAAKFDASMTQLHTQAGVSQNKIAGLKQGVLALAGKVGQDPDSLAESLYHVESNFESTGISGKKALSLVETAAKGATLGHADLVDVTNALTAAVASGIPGVQNFDKAMGVLNATVGTGDMKMQDLASAFGSGMVATVAGFGLNIQDVGAALAVFGDNNIRGANAGTQLRMSVQALAHPVATAGEALKRLGLTQDTLKNDMQKGGLKLAMEDLVGRMKKAGISAKEQGGVITDAFGKKAGSGLNILVREFEKLESKYPAGIAGANKFGGAWATTQKTFAFQMKALQAGFDALAITVGTKLMPPLQSVVGVMLAHKGATVAVAGALAGLLTVTVAVSAAMKAAAAATMLWSGATRGVAAIKGVFETVALKAMYMREAFSAAGGGIAGLKAAFASLSAVGKGSIIITGLALAAVGIQKLATMARGAPPDVDKLTTSLKTLAATGKTTGELKSSIGSVDQFVAKLNRLKGEEAGLDKGLGWSKKYLAMGPIIDNVVPKIDDLLHGTKSMGAAKDDFKAFDEGLAQLAQGGHAKEAADAFRGYEAAMLSSGRTQKDINALFPKYSLAVADAGAESELTAKAMGIFGAAAVSTQKNLDAEAMSAKGLEQSIMALNAVHRAAFDAETAFEQAISDSSKAVKENGRTLNIHTDAGRKNRAVLSDLAAKTEDYIDKMNKQHFAADQVDKAYAKGRKAFIDTAMAMGDTRKEAEKLAKLLLNPPKAQATKLKVDKKAAEADLKSFNAAVKKSPGAKSVTLKALSSGAEKVLESFGFKVKHLKNGTVQIFAKDGQALGQIADVNGAMNALDGKTATTYVITKTSTSNAGSVFHEGGKYAAGGMVRRYADGGGIEGGSGTQDDVPLLAMGGEFIVNKRQTSKYRALLEAINEDRVPHFAKGGHLSKSQRAAQAKAKAAAKAEADARHELHGEFGISYFGRAAGYTRTPFEHNLGAPSDVNALVSSLNEAAGKIKAAFHGRTESNLLKHLNSVGKSLINYEKKLTSVTASLDKAKDKLNGLKDAASQLKDSVKSSLISSANITKGAGGDQTVTLGSIRGQMVMSRDKVVAFASALKQLRAKGYSKSIIQQVAEAGIDGGGLETAGALLEASSSEVSSFNSTQSQIESAAGSAGQTTADSVYGAAIKAQTAVVKTLTTSQNNLKKSMDRLAKSMEKMIEKALKGKASGGIVGAAATGGIRSGLTLVGEQGPELAELPVGSRVLSNPDSMRRLAAAQAPWASMLNTPRRAPTAAGGVGGRAQEVKVVLEIQGTTNSRYEEFLLTEIRRMVRARGGNVQQVINPPRGM
ncbi:phage tail tape measure protein [Streptomyces sp. NPDC127038]|uniref:phage tail tape measure protein n=1 Tax=Streptomyces sp. NPDC127038 TaxID=3347114 RepID=UPI003665B6CC